MQYINPLLVVLKEGLQQNPTYHLTAQALPGLNPLDHTSRLTLLPHQDVQHLAWDDVNGDDGDFVDDGDSDGLGLPRGVVSLLCR